MSYSETITYEDLKRILETIPLSTITYGRGEVGEIKPFAGSTIPTGWLLCDGSAVSRTTYSELFTVIGTTYGTGDGSTTFNLPDLRNRFMVGAGDEYELNDKGGDKNVTLDTTMIPAHTHGNKSLSGTFDIRKWGGSGDTIFGSSGIVSYSQITVSASSNATSTNPNAAQRITVNASHEHTSVGGGQAHENRPPYIGINFIIYAKNTKTVTSPQIDLFYPVGAYFETSDSTFDPNVKWGGTWISDDINTFEKSKLLWTNNSASSFASQDIPLDLTNYDYIKVWFYPAATSDVNFQNPVLVKIGERNDILYLHTMRADGVNENTGVRSVVASTTGVAFGAYAYKNRRSGGTQTIANQFCVPYQIYGVKNDTIYKWHRTA